MTLLSEMKSRELISELDIESSYIQNNLGIFLYETVLSFSPQKIVEFGTLFGYSAICMGLALRTIGRGSLVCFDLWDDYPYKKSKKEEVQQRIKKLGLEDYITLEKGDVFSGDWSDLDFDFCHVDVSNDGEKISKIYKTFEKKIKRGVPIIFEGGTPERDSVHWMKQYNKVPIESVKINTGYTVINNKFPGISIFSESINREFLDNITHVTNEA